MASIRKEVIIEASSEQVWAAVRDIGALHTRLVVGFVTACQLDGDARIVTFANGLVARETIVDLDDGQRRLVWAAVGGRLAHHNASLQVFAEGSERTHVVWIADLLPNELAQPIEAMMEHGTLAMKNTLERARSDG